MKKALAPLIAVLAVPVLAGGAELELAEAILKESRQWDGSGICAAR